MPKIAVPKIGAGAVPQKQLIAFAIVAVIIVAGVIFATVFLQAPPGAPKPAEERATDLLTGELGAIQDMDISEMEGLLKLMIS